MVISFDSQHCFVVSNCWCIDEEIDELNRIDIKFSCVELRSSNVLKNYFSLDLFIRCFPFLASSRKVFIQFVDVFRCSVFLVFSWILKVDFLIQFIYYSLDILIDSSELCWHCFANWWGVWSLKFCWYFLCRIEVFDCSWRFVDVEIFYWWFVFERPLVFSVGSNIWWFSSVLMY